MSQLLKIKICSRCRIEKPIDQFHKGKNFKDGLQPQCKDCRRSYFINNRSVRRVQSKLGMRRYRAKLRGHNV